MLSAAGAVYGKIAPHPLPTPISSRSKDIGLNKTGAAASVKAGGQPASSSRSSTGTKRPEKLTFQERRKLFNASQASQAGSKASSTLL